MTGKKPGTRDTLSDRDLQKGVKSARKAASLRPPIIPDLYSEDDMSVKEPSAVSTMNQQMAWQAIGRMEKRVEGTANAINAQGEYIKKIPKLEEETAKAVEAAQDSVQETRVMATKLDSVDRRVERLAKRVDVGHECRYGGAITKLQDSVQKDAYQGGKIKERVGAVERGFEEHKRTTVSSKAKIITTIISVGIVAAGAIYGYGRFTERVTDVEEDFTRIQDDVDELPEKIVKRTKFMIDTAVKTAVSESRVHGTKFDPMCEGMSSREKRRMRDMLKGRPIPPSCQ